ncbi:MAG: DUF4058 family protein [Planctomycetes bacterium]|nr:DUF4058 family protein [Planctomycetota bacterium]
MPIHDWTRTYAGALHDLHVTWLVELKRVLNKGLLPPGYYAMGEQVIGGAVPDVLTLERSGPPGGAETSARLAGAAGEALEPTATITAVAEAPRYPPRPRVIAVRHASGHRLVAMIEIVSAGNKSDAADLGSLVEKTVVTLSKGVHVVLIDLHRPGSFDPQGIHNLVWMELGQDPVDLPPDRPLQVVSYLSHGRVSSYIEPLRVGDRLPDVPLFLAPGLFVSLPLEATYQAAFDALPDHLKEELARG